MSEDRYVELDERGEALLREYAAADQAAKAWAERRDDLTTELLALLGDANKGTVAGRHVVTRIGSGTVNLFSQSRFKAAYPDLYNDFVVPTPRRPYLRLVT